MDDLQSEYPYFLLSNTKEDGEGDINCPNCNHSNQAIDGSDVEKLVEDYVAIIAAVAIAVIVLK